MITCVLNADVGGLAGQRVVLRDGVVEDISADGVAPREASVIDARGGALIPGLRDHHVHVRSAAARRTSIEVGDLSGRDELAARIRSHLQPGRALRAVGYDSDRLGQLTLTDLETLLPGAPPIRMQHRSGHHWVLNTAARALVTSRGFAVPPDGVLWDEDTALSAFPSVVTTAAVTEEFRRMRARGVIGAADLTVTNAAEDADVLRSTAAGIIDVSVFGTPDAARRGGVDGVKLLVHDHLGTSPDQLAESISSVPAVPFALHAVTDAALALGLAACHDGPDDVPARTIRFEHAFICPPDAVTAIAASGASVGAHPGFILTQGDRLVTALTAPERQCYQPLRSLVDAGVALYGGTDAPYGTSDVWAAMQVAVVRRTPGGHALGAHESLTPEEALAMFSTHGLRDEAAAPTVAVGDSAVCLLDRPWSIARTALASTRVVTVLDH
ncbi:amidohydrolase family protein [Citricoccus sp. NPDC055426]|uniref:amidohydrolase family protein n=1 Tax=Citricoccus sp. NPDC055426 TaxID=3155536 RepID=UPI0034336079